jgi:predicted ArsR family transcriptional regulator
MKQSPRKPVENMRARLLRIWAMHERGVSWNDIADDVGTTPEKAKEMLAELRVSQAKRVGQ